MIRLVLGAAAAAVAMLVLSFIITMTPLAGLGAGNVTTAQAAGLQQQLAATFRDTGTYRVPDPNTAEQTGLYAQGPIATIAYNQAGGANAAAGPMRYLYALILNFLVAFGIGAALVGVERSPLAFGNRWRAGLLFGFAAAAFIHLSQPIWMLSDWRTALFRTIADGLILSVAALIVAWFAKRPAASVMAEAGLETVRDARRPADPLREHSSDSPERRVE